MARINCPACGAPVDLVEVNENGKFVSIPLEINEDSTSDADRYVIVGHDPLRAHKVTAQANRGQPDHRFDCPGANAGR